MDIVPLKCCSTCKQEKPATLFFHKSSSHDHLTSQCKQCILQHQREQRGLLPIPPEGLKRCRTCKEVKPATPEFFHRGPSGKDGLRGTCKACRIQTSKEEYRKYALHRTEEQKERRRQYREQYRKRTKNGFNREVGTLVGNTTGNISRIGNNTIKTIVSTTRSTIVTIEKPTLRN